METLKETETRPVLMAYPLFAMLPTGKKSALTGQQDMTAIIQGGMELRDYFAGQALSGFLNKTTIGGAHTLTSLAIVSYRLADEMLAARSRVTLDKG